MDNDCEFEELNEFYESLKLLHSNESDSQRKLYHMVIQSIRKHHPTVKHAFGQKYSMKSSSGNCVFKNTVCKTEKSSVQHNHVEDGHHRHTMINKPSLTSKNSSRLDYEPRYYQGTLDDSYLKQISLVSQPMLAVTDAPSNHLLVKIPTQPLNLNEVYEDVSSTKNNMSPLNSSSFSHPPKHRIAHTGSKDQSLTSKSISPRSLLSRHKLSNCSSPVNLKRIRAVLARGDPFPTHLVKACINNITPDLQKEKL